MDEKTTTSINVILNHWSLTIQVAILSVFVIIFIALKINSSRRMINSWLLAWLSNAMALSMVILVLIGTDHFSSTLLRLLYCFYAIAKIWFALLLLEGLFRLIQQRPFITGKILSILLSASVIFQLLLMIFSVQLLMIQILVYLFVGSLFFCTSLLFMKHFWAKTSSLIFIIFLIEGMVFLHHGIILIPVINGALLPDYMTHISFFDALVEMIVGISCLFVIAHKVIGEISIRNQVLAKSQSTLRKLINTDPLTGLWQRSYFETFLKQYHQGATLVYFKIDQLPAINDEWGYSVGDLCIKETAHALKNIFTNEDGLFRIGGNTFLVICPGINKKNVQKKMQRFKNKVATNPVCAPILTISSNITCYQEKTELTQALLSENNSTTTQI